jgi:hypothetical protein
MPMQLVSILAQPGWRRRPVAAKSWPNTLARQSTCIALRWAGCPPAPTCTRCVATSGAVYKTACTRCTACATWQSAVLPRSSPWMMHAGVKGQATRPKVCHGTVTHAGCSDAAGNGGTPLLGPQHVRPWHAGDPGCAQLHPARRQTVDCNCGRVPGASLLRWGWCRHC